MTDTFDPILSTILADAAALDAKPLGESLSALARGESVDASDATLRVAWLLLVRETAAHSGGLVTGRLSLDLLRAGQLPLGEFLEDRRVFCQAHPRIVAAQHLPAHTLWSANYVHGVLDAKGTDLLALVLAPVLELAGREVVYPAETDPRVRAWLEGTFQPLSSADHLHFGRALASVDPDEAYEVLTAGLDALGTPQMRGEFQTALGFVAAERGDWPDARARFEDVIADDDDPDVAVLRELGVACIHSGDVELGRGHLDRVLKQQPDHYAALSSRAFALSHLGLHELAAVDAGRQIELDPYDAAPLYNRALHRYHLGDVDAALLDLDAALKLDPGYGDAYNNRGMLRESRGDIEGAIEDFTAALDTGIGPVALLNRARVFETDGRLPDAIADVSEAIDAQPAVEMYATRARLFAAQGTRWRAISDSVTVLRASAALDERVRDALTRLETLEYEETIAYPLPRDPAALVTEGLSHEDRSDAEAAVASYERALAIDPGHADALYNLGNLRMAVGELDLAASLFSRAIEVQPGDVQSRLNRGTVRFQQAVLSPSEDLVTLAARDFEGAILAQPNYPMGYVKLGVLELLEGRVWNALLLNLIALTLFEPDDPRADSVRAELDAEVRPRLSPDAHELAAAALHLWLPALLQLNLLRSLVTVCETLLQETPTAPPAYVLTYLGAGYWRGELDTRAEELLAQAHALEPSAVAATLRSLVDREIVQEDIFTLLPDASP